MRAQLWKEVDLGANCGRWVGLAGMSLLTVVGLGLSGEKVETPSSTAPLPQAPEGVRVLSVAAFTAKEQEPVRIAAHPVTGRLYVLGGGGDVTLIDLQSGKKRRVLAGSEYIE